MVENKKTMENEAKKKILSTIRVMDFGRVIAAPFCARMLSDLGAEVIKIETGDGDPIRLNPPYKNGFGAIFTQYNVGKKSICVDLRNPKGLELIKKLVTVSDVVVENFRPGVMAKMGLDYSVLRQINPRIILCSISGFGQTGPERDRIAYADIIHAYSGLEYLAAKMKGTDADPPGFPYSFADSYGALNATIAILAALFHRQASGEGQAIDISLLDSVLGANDDTLQTFIFSDGALDTPVIPRAPFRMKNGAMAISVVMAFKRVIMAMDRPDLIMDERFKTEEVRLKKENFDQFLKIVREWAKTVTVEEASELFRRYEVPCAKVNSLAELVNKPVLRERKMLVEMELAPSAPPALVLNTPLRLSQCPTGPQSRPPHRGEHNRVVVGDLLGFKEDEIQKLLEEGILSHDLKAFEPISQ